MYYLAPFLESPLVDVVTCTKEESSLYFSSIIIRNISDCKQVLKVDFSLEASDQDCEVVRRVCEAVSTRAARLAASGIVALVKKINKLDGCSVAVDGSLYKLHPKFPDRYRICIINAVDVCILCSTERS